MRGSLRRSGVSILHASDGGGETLTIRRQDGFGPGFDALGLGAALIFAQDRGVGLEKTYQVRMLGTQRALRYANGSLEISGCQVVVFLGLVDTAAQAQQPRHL